MKFAVRALVLMTIPLLCSADPRARAETETAPTTKKDRKKKSTGLARNSKDTEGSEAPHRFEAETVIRSQYTLDGKPLEVDTD